MNSNPKAEPTVFIIFGGTGDLNARKLAPALYNLFIDGYLPDQFSFIGTGRTPLTDDQFTSKILEDINDFSRRGKVDENKWKEFAPHIQYQVSDINDFKTYSEFGAKIKAHEEEWKCKPQVIYYLAVAPNFFPIISENISKAKLAVDPNKTRIVIEKPFGHDLKTAKELNKLLSGIFSERQIYRIDHYLGKETVQNIMAYRFANSIMEPLWNRNFIEHVQISVMEQLGVEERGPYYEGAGALRDMIQNHLLQLLCLVAMEPPVNFSPNEVRDRRVDVLKAMRRFKKEEVSHSAVRGQYGPGWMKGKQVVGYREESKVDPDSNTETFAAIKFFVDNWRWQGVPFYLRTGKRLHESSSIITIQFKDVPHIVFSTSSSENWQQNKLLISIQPEMSIRLQVQAKRPGIDMVLNPVDMVFDYKGTYISEAPEAYETLLLDILKGDQTLFMRADQVEEAWDLIMPILETWESKKSINFPNYSSDSFGPELAEALIAKDGFHWFSLPQTSTKKEKE